VPTSPPPTDGQSAQILERLRASLAGRYELEGEIGRGGMATVYLARDLRHDRHVAVKVLPPELSTAIAAERFVFEIRTAAQLLHPHILGLIDSGDADGVLYYIMPHVSGESLRDKLERERRLTVEEAARITREVASALTYAQEHGVVHRDIKPENVLLVDGTHAMVSDFGLSRAILRSADRRLTQSRHVVGTVFYMSPEQAGSDGTLDGRSDIYSLGCVLYEMLAGRPPFDAESDLAVLARHLRERPPRLASQHVDVPDAVERVIHRALEKDPDRRYQTASDLSRDLDVAISGGGRPWYARGLFPPRRARYTGGLGTGLIALAVLVCLAGAAGLALVTPMAKPVRARIAALWSAPLDSSRYAILPFRRSADTPREMTPELMLHDAFARWSGVNVVEQFQVRDAVSRLDTLHLGARDARAVSGSFGAGRYVWGDLATVGDSLRIHASLYDAATGSQLHDITIKLDRASLAHDEPYRRIADALLFHGMAAVAHEQSDAGTTSYAARWAFLRGQLALQEWNLATADSAFAQALADDANFAAAYLWLAQVRGWTSDNPQQWRVLAGNAVARHAQLPEHDQKLASALLHMSRGEYPRACALYQGLRATDPHDFTAAYGLGECVRRDDVVVADARSPSGWRFRASRFQAMNAYRDALELLPSINKAFRAHAFERLRGILLTDASMRVWGRALPPDTTRFRTAPSWQGDSLVLIPFPTGLEQLAPERTLSATTVEAVDHQRVMFRDLAASWRRTFPDEVVPREAMTVALELLGDSTALDTLREARRLASDDEQRIRLAAEEVWLRVKFGVPDNVASLTMARELADSLLRAGLRAPSSSDELLANLAVLSGKADAAATLARRAAEQERPWGTLPARTSSSARALLVFSTLGGPADSLRGLEPHVAAEIRAAVASKQQYAVFSALLGQAAGLSFPIYRFESLTVLAGHDNPILDAQAAYAKGDLGGAHQILENEQKFRASVRPADMTLDITYSGAWTLAAIGDRAAAVQWLDPVLNAAQLYPPQVISRLANAGALMRAMILRAELARASGDSATARRWARPVAILWRDADPFLRSVVREMQMITSGRARPAELTN
jgi:tRNA A-37 threonylcarbamoyl transferase component Bud32/tetratricopeptide (TPR) repeat protein